MLWRQGDVYITQVDAIPADAQALPHCVLADGEQTGHSHRIELAETARLWESGGQRFLDVVSTSAVVVHQEHAAITLPPGTYRFWQQREYVPGSERSERIVCD